MFLHADRTHAGSTTTMRNGKSLMQVEVTNIGADQPRCRQADLCIHVSAVHVYLSAMLMNNSGDFLYCFFINAISTGIGDHDTRKHGGILSGLGLQVFDVDVPV